MLIDVHAHLDYFSEEKIKEIIKGAKKNNIKVIVNNSLNLESCKKSIEFSKKYSVIKAAVGIYPEEKVLRKELEEFKKFVSKNKKQIFAIGEIGMDFKYGEDKKLQENAFVYQLKIAEKLKVPAIIHTRKAEKEVIGILKNLKGKNILHAFHGKLKLADAAVKIGCYFSIPTNIVHSEHFQKLVKILPPERVLTETDAPYLSPYKDRKNEPEFIKESIKVISNIWEKSVKETERQIEENFNRIFNDQNIIKHRIFNW